MTRSEIRRRYVGKIAYFTDPMGRTQTFRVEYIGKRGVCGVGEDGSIVDGMPAEVGDVGGMLHFKMAAVTFQKGRHQLRT